MLSFTENAVQRHQLQSYKVEFQEINNKPKMRLLIVGNSGSGKSYTGTRLSSFLQLPCHHLDKIFFKPGGFTAAYERPKEEIQQELDKIRQSDKWIVEGIFGDLIERCVPNATHFLFLDLSPAECEQGLRRRGLMPECWDDAEIGKKKFDNLLEWSSGYWTRRDRFSHAQHLNLYESFPGVKWRLKNLSELNEWLLQWETK